MKSPLLRLKPYLKPFTPHILGSLLLAIPLSALRFSPVPIAQRVIDDLFVSKDSSKLVLIPALFIGLYVANFVVRFFHYYLLRVVVARVNQRLKNDLFQHIMGLSADYFTQQSNGTLISRVGSDTQYIDGGIAQLNVLIREPITFIFLLGYTLHLNWRLTLVIFLMVPPIGWVFARTGKNLKRYIRSLTDENAGLFSTLQESFAGVRVIKSFRLEKYVRKRFRERSEGFATALLKTAKLEEVAHPTVELLYAFAIAGVFYYGGRLVIEGVMKPGELIAFFTAFALMMNPIRTLNDASMKISNASAACARIFEIFDWKSNLAEPVNPKGLRGFNDRIEFRDVRFAYPDAPEREVLRGVTFGVGKREVVAIVGASGAGKSSLVSLLPRIFDVTSGSILIDGTDLREFYVDQLRSHIAVVSQDVFLFNDTIAENIRCGRLSATPDEIREAARKANALEFIERLPAGMATVCGDRGQKLSGGEKQRISIARAFLREAPILILDEATSSLDSRSERAVQAALEELMRERTTIVIAHRLSTIRSADRILVLKEGLLVESGTHDELIAREGEYARFHRVAQDPASDTASASSTDAATDAATESASDAATGVAPETGTRAT